MVDGSPESIDKALQAVSSLLLNKVSWAAAGTVAWILLSALKMNTDSTLQDAALAPNVQRYLGKLEQEPSISDSEALHSSVLAWRIPGIGKPGGLLSMGSHRVGHD